MVGMVTFWQYRHLLDMALALMRELPSDVCGRSSSFCQSWLYKGWKGWPVLARCWCRDSPLCWDDCSWFRGRCATLLRPCDVGDRSMEWAVKMLQHACSKTNHMNNLTTLVRHATAMLAIDFSLLREHTGRVAEPGLLCKWFQDANTAIQNFEWNVFRPLGLGGGHSSTSHLGFLVRWCDALKWGLASCVDPGRSNKNIEKLNRESFATCRASRFHLAGRPSPRLCVSLLAPIEGGLRWRKWEVQGQLEGFSLGTTILLAKYVLLRLSHHHHHHRRRRRRRRRRHHHHHQVISIQLFRRIVYLLRLYELSSFHDAMRIGLWY